MSYKTICFCKGNGCSDGAVCVVLQAMQSDKYFKKTHCNTTNPSAFRQDAEGTNAVCRVTSSKGAKDGCSDTHCFYATVIQGGQGKLPCKALFFPFSEQRAFVLLRKRHRL